MSRQAPAGSRAAVFLDRDGVVNRRLEGDYVRDWSLFEFLPGAAEAIRRLNALGYPVVVVSNQQGIGKGLMSERDLEEIHRRMTAELASLGARLEGVYHCPHLADAGCACRKPMPGLILSAAAELGLDPACSWMVGDSPSDLEAGRRAGCRPVLIGEGDCGGCPVFSDLLAFAAALEEGSVGG